MFKNTCQEAGNQKVSVTGIIFVAFKIATSSANGTHFTSWIPKKMYIPYQKLLKGLPLKTK